ncbi:MAG: hypothetical protein GY888_06895, partial [Planctomycetaceae bacterium]|nr:hypothetical protein [Planctomycetaceae bacterium]
MTGSPIVPRPDYSIATTPLGADFGAAIDQAGCDVLQQAGDAAFRTGIGMMAWGFVKPGAVLTGAGALATYAARIGCPYGVGGSSGSGGLFCDVNTDGVCLEHEQGEGNLYYEYDGGWSRVGFNYAKLLSIGCDESEPPDQTDSKGYLFTYRDIEYTDWQGNLQISNVILRYKPGQVPLLKSEPLSPDDPVVPDGKCSGKPRVKPWEGFNANNCEMTISTKGWGQTPGGNVAPIMLMEPGHQLQKWEDEKQWEDPQRGPISDDRPYDFSNTCNFSPVLVFPDPDGPLIVKPWDDLKDLSENIEDLGKDLNRRLDQQDQDLDDINGKLDDLLDRPEPPTPEPPVQIPGGTLTFTAACDKDDEGNLEKVEYPLLPANGTNAALIALYDNQTTLMTMIQQHLIWKTPICKPEKPELEGQWVTTRWMSDEKVVGSERRLRKLFRYRTKSTRDVGQLSDFWKDFTWRSGPVIVFHKGAWWGTPKVWAETETEGKRVLRFAAGE